MPSRGAAPRPCPTMRSAAGRGRGAGPRRSGRPSVGRRRPCQDPGAERRTPVRAWPESAAATDDVGEGRQAMPRPGTMREPVFRLAGPRRTAGDVGSVFSSTGQAVPVSGGDDPTMTALRAAAARDAEAPSRPSDGKRWSRLRSAAAPARPRTAGRPCWTVAARRVGRSSGDGAAKPAAAGTAAPRAADAAESRNRPRRRVRPATSRDGSPTSAASSRRGPGPERSPRRRRSARRSEHCDEHEAAAEAAATAADARAVRQAKDDAQARFRSGRAMAATTEDVEAAARAWLLEINAIKAQPGRRSRR